MTKVDLARVVADTLLDESKETLACAEFIDRYMFGDGRGANVIERAERIRAKAESYFGAEVVRDYSLHVGWHDRP